MAKSRNHWVKKKKKKIQLPKIKTSQSTQLNKSHFFKSKIKSPMWLDQMRVHLHTHTHQTNKQTNHSSHIDGFSVHGKRASCVRWWSLQAACTIEHCTAFSWLYSAKGRLALKLKDSIFLMNPHHLWQIYVVFCCCWLQHHWFVTMRWLKAGSGMPWC